MKFSTDLTYKAGVYILRTNFALLGAKISFNSFQMKANLQGRAFWGSVRSVSPPNQSLRSPEFKNNFGYLV